VNGNTTRTYEPRETSGANEDWQEQDSA
jgi:hypothetical protein